MSAPYHTSSMPRPETEPYKGVGGWLMVFIILILFVIPLLTAFNGLVSFAFAARVSRYFPLIMFLTLVDILCSALVTCFGMVTGIFLWTQNSRGAGLARIYLFTRAFYAAFLLFIVGLSMETSDMPVPIQQELPRRVLIGSLPSILFVMIWYGYFKRSKRVKATFGDPQDDYLTLELK